MGEEEKQAQPQPAEAAEAKPAAEKVSDEEFASILSDSFGDFKKLANLLPSFKTADGDLVRGIEWLDPKKDFQRKEFLTKKDFAVQRKLLGERLKLWVQYLSQSDNLDEVRKSLSEQSAKLETNLEKNMKKVHQASRELETTYRGIDKFFTNAQQEPDEKVNAWFANASAEALTDPDDGVEEAVATWRGRRDLILDELADCALSLVYLSGDGLNVVHCAVYLCGDGLHLGASFFHYFSKLGYGSLEVIHDLGRVVLFHGHGLLPDDRSRVVGLVYIVNGHPCLPGAGCDYGPVHVQPVHALAAEIRKQSRVNVEYALRESPDNFGGQQFHVTCQQY